MFEFSDTERDRRWGAVRDGMAEEGFDCLVVWGSYGCYRDSNQNLQYLTNVNSEGFLLFPADGEPTLYSFENGLNPSWVTDWRGAIPNFADAIGDRIDELKLARAHFGLISVSGIFGEMSGFPHATLEKLTSRFGGASFDDTTELVEKIRRIKSDEEIACLEAGGKVITEQVFPKIAEVAGPGVRDFEVRAEIMDTLFRNHCDPGSMILYCQGKDVMHGGQSGGWLEPRFDTPLETGHIILIELDGVMRGYKAQFNTAFAVGEPDEEWQRIFDAAFLSYTEGEAVLKAGITAGELEDVMLAPLKEGGWAFGNPAFHGLGLGIEQPMGTYPRVGWEVDRDFVIEENMVIEFEPHPATPDLRRAASIGGPMLVETDGCRILADWAPEIIVV